MAVVYSMIFTNDVTLQDGVTLNDGTTTVDKYITRVRGILVGTDDESGLKAQLDLHLDAANADQKNPAEFVEFADLLDIPDSLKAGLIALGELPENKAQVQSTIDSLATSPYGENAMWAETEEAL